MIFWNVRLLHYQELKYRKIPVLRYVNFNTTLAKKKVGIPLKVIEKKKLNFFFCGCSREDSEIFVPSVKVFVAIKCGFLVKICKAKQRVN